MSRALSLFYKFRDWHFVHKLEKKHRAKVRNRANGYVLTRQQEAQIRDFFAPYGKVDLGAHNFYTEKTGQFHVNYMPDDFYYSRIDAYFNDWRECSYIDNKCFYGRYFPNIRRPQEVAQRTGGLWYNTDYQLISRQELDALLEKEPEIVAKMARSCGGGRGVFFLPGKDFASIEHKFDDDIVIQRPLQQHAGIAAINESSVNTIRIISLLTEEGVKVYSAIMRIGIGGARVDNASAGGITCGITSDGKLKKYAYTVKGQRFEQHPTSGLPFEGIEVPGFALCMAAVPQLHIQIPRFHLVSWDFAVDTDGQPVLIEANMHYGEVDFHQLNNGPIFGDDTEKILNLVFKNQK